MARILISGYYGLGNLGDEAVLEAMTASLRREDASVELEVLTADPARARELGLRPVPRKDPGAILKALFRSDLLVSGGGGLIQDSTGLASVIYYLGISTLARLLRRPVMFYAQGFGPVRSQLGKTLTRLLANRVNLITVRDQESADGFRAAGVTTPPIRVTADPVMALEPAPPGQIRRILAAEQLMQHIGRLEGPTGRQSETGPLVAVSVRPWPSFELETVAAGLQKFSEKEKARYLIVPFHPEFDAGLSQELAHRLDGVAWMLRRPCSPAEMAGVLRCCDLVLGMRLHSLILAAGGGIPFVGLSYDPKVERFCRRAGAVPLAIDSLSVVEVTRALGHLLTGRAQARRLLQARLQPMAEAARRTARAAVYLARGQGMAAALGVLDALD